MYACDLVFTHHRPSYHPAALGLLAVSLLAGFPALTQDAALLQQADPNAKEPVPIDDGGGQAAMSAGSGTADGTGSGTGGQPIASPFNFQTDLITGRFTYSVPIVVPPGRQGAQPTLGLVYNSAGGNAWCGVGWNLDVGFIQRDTRRGVPVKWGATNALNEYDDAKCFVANFGGVNSCLVPVTATNQSPTDFRAEVDSTFLLYRYYWNQTEPQWQVIDKGSNTFFFGANSDSRMESTKTNWTAPNYGKGVFRWALDRVVDVNGNETTLSYTKHSNMLYLANISYNGNVNAGLSKTHTVDFELIGRTDKTISFQPGYRVETAKLLSNIVVKVSGNLVRRYQINYTNSPSTFRSLIASVTQFGSDNSTTLPPQTFSYQFKPFEFESAKTWTGIDGQGASTSAQGVHSLRCVSTAADTYVDIVDIDSDGLPDRIMRRFSAPHTNLVVQRNTGSGFATATGWGPLESQNQTNDGWNSIRGGSTRNQMYLDLADINGDGYPDRVMRKLSSPHTNFVVQLNSGTPAGTGFAGARTWGPVTNESSAEEWRSVRWGQYVKVDLMDINGDGLPDRVARKLNGPYNRYQVQFNHGDGFTGLYEWTPVDSEDTADFWNSVSAVNDSGDTFAGMFDINGDGLIDRVLRRANTPYSSFMVQFNNGAGFEWKEQWNSLISQGETSSPWNCPRATDSDNDTFQSLVDINADGLPDRVMRRVNSPYTNFVVYLNTGSGFQTNGIVWQPLDTLGESANGWGSVTALDSDSDTLVDLVDMNGDGMIDRVMQTNHAPYNQWVVQLNKGPFPDLLYEARNGLGGKVNVTYKPSTEFDNRDRDYSGDPWAAGAISKLGFPVWTVSSITANNGMGGSYTTTYGYKGGFFDTARREFRGFNRVEVTDPAGTRSVTYFHQGGGRDESANGEFADQTSMAKKGLPYRIEVWGDSGNTNLYRLTLNKVEEKLLHANGWYFPFVSQTIQMAYEGLGAGNYRATADRLAYDTNTGNVLISTNLGEVSGVNFSDHTFTDVDTSDSVYTITTYTNIGSIQNKPLAITVSKSSSGSPALRQSVFKYDGHGNLTESKAWLDTASAYVTNSIVTYDNVGNPTQATDAAGITTTTTYDSTYRIFPVQTVTGTFTNKAFVNVLSGTVISTVDPNGMSTTNILDVLFRSTETRVSTNSTSGPTLWRTRTDYTLLGAAGALSTNVVRKRVYEVNDTANGIEAYAYFDGLGRGIQTRTESETNGVFRVMDVVFDERGNVAVQSLPYFGSGSACAFPTGDHLGAYMEFDPIGRAFRGTPAVKLSFDSNGQITNEAPVFTNGDTDSPVGSVTTYFSDGTNPWAKSVADAENKTSKSFFDAFGRVTNIVNVVSGGNINTYFKYDPVGNLTNVTDHSNNITRIVYDSLGRKTSMTDPDMGTWTYKYDNAGRLTEQVDAKNQKIKFFFSDQLGRMTKKEVYDSSSNLAYTVTYAYDTNVAGFTGWKGAMTGMVDKEGWARVGFDERGRATNDTRYLSKNDTTYIISTKYNDANQVTETRYPTTTTVRIGYTYTNGILYTVKSLEGTGTSAETFYQLHSLNEFGQPVAYKTHSGTVTHSYSYYPNSKRLLNAIVSKPGGGYHQDLNYKFDKVSNIKGIIDSQYSGTCAGSISNLVYDDLHRLTSLSHAGGTRTYAYNALGNMLTNADSGTGQYKYGTKPHAVTNANGASYAYDANGNMISRNGDTLSYDEENRLVDYNSEHVTYGYADDGTRLWRETDYTTFQCWIGGIYEEKAPGKLLCHVFAGGQRIATFEPASGGPYASVWAPKTIWAQTAETADTIATWPLREGRTPWTVLLSTLVLLLVVCVQARRGLGVRSSPAVSMWMLRALAKLLQVGTSHRDVRSAQRANPTLVGRDSVEPWNSERRTGWREARELETQNPKLETELTARERRWFTQPLWRQAMSLLMIVALVFVTTPTEVQAQTYSPVFYYYIPDHLGSSNVMTDRAGVLVEHYEYTAFGNAKCSTGTAFQVSNRYTGQVLDEETGLYYYGSRYYDPALGRFIQPDTVVPNPGDSQQFNRYSYVNNNPLKYTDPTGHAIDWVAAAVAVVIYAAVGAAVGAAVAAATGGDPAKGAAGGALSGALCAVVPYVGSVAGAAITAAIYGDDVGQAAVTASIGMVIGFGVGVYLGPALSGAGGAWGAVGQVGISAGAGALSGGISAEMYGGDFADGAMYGATSAAVTCVSSLILEETVKQFTRIKERSSKVDVLKRDSASEPLFEPTGNIIDNPDFQRAGYTRMQEGYLTTKDGMRIKAYKNLTANLAWQTDCHGYSLTDGKYWIDNEDMQGFLAAQQRSNKPLIVQTAEPSVGNLIVYREGGNVVHSAILVAPGIVRMAAGTEIFSGSKTTLRTVSGAWNDPKTIEYWRMK